MNMLNRKVNATKHLVQRMQERGITAKDINEALNKGIDVILANERFVVHKDLWLCIKERELVTAFRKE